MVGATHQNKISMYPEVVESLAFDVENARACSHWQGGDDTSLTQLARYSKHWEKSHCVSIDEWLSRSGALSSHSSKRSRGVSLESSVVNNEDKPQRTNANGLQQRVFQKSGIEIQKGSSFRGVYRASDTEWEVYVTEANSIDTSRHHEVRYRCDFAAVLVELQLDL